MIPHMRIIKLTLLFGFLLFAATSCIKPTPIPVYVTPTPAGPTATVTQIVEAVSSPVPGVTPAAPTPMLVTPAEGTIFGPVVPPGYTPGPTWTPRPTTTATPSTPTITPTPSITPTPPPGLNPQLIGVQIHPAITQDEWREMLHWGQQLGVGWVKVQFAWDEMEPDGPGSQSVYWRQLELYVQDALSRGFQVMISIAKAPDWARSTTEQNGPPNDPQTLVNFINRILSEFGPAIHAIEIWNEPNLEREWSGAPMNGSAYMALFGPAYQAIRAWSQQNSHPIRVITAGLAPVGNVAGAVDDRVFLQQMYAAGLARYTDVAVGVHPYGWGNSPLDRCCNPVPDRNWDDDPHFFFLNTIESYRQIMVANGDSDAELWGTEFGWATYDGLGGTAPQPFFNYVTEQTQAQYLIEALDLLQNSGQYDYVGVMIVWNLNFATLPGAIERQEEQAGYSLLRPDKSWRPAFGALHDALPRR